MELVAGILNPELHFLLLRDACRVVARACHVRSGGSRYKVHEENTLRCAEKSRGLLSPAKYLLLLGTLAEMERKKASRIQ